MCDVSTPFTFNLNTTQFLRNLSRRMWTKFFVWKKNNIWLSLIRQKKWMVAGYRDTLSPFRLFYSLVFSGQNLQFLISIPYHLQHIVAKTWTNVSKHNARLWSWKDSLTFTCNGSIKKGALTNIEWLCLGLKAFMLWHNVEHFYFSDVSKKWTPNIFVV